MQAAQAESSSGDTARIRERFLCAQRIRVALAALESAVIYRESLSEDSIYILKQLAESAEELEMEHDELARAIILRESARLERLAPAPCD